MAHCQLFTLAGELISDVVQQVNVGKKEVIPAIEYALKQMRRGEKALLLAPWYTAYGAIGNEEVKPYTNLKIEIEVE